ncbi:hypothetical protein [Deinococcus sonorensis]|uniref:Uncharacterized protein n=2 Tax=Deinococcus sonorensis TaxID=309891 RepID=A0AAU7UCE1_9DEIO
MTRDPRDEARLREVAGLLEKAEACLDDAQQVIDHVREDQQEIRQALTQQREAVGIAWEALTHLHPQESLPHPPKTEN